MPDSSVHQDGAFQPLGNVTQTTTVVIGVMSRTVVRISTLDYYIECLSDKMCVFLILIVKRYQYVEQL